MITAVTIDKQQGEILPCDLFTAFSKGRQSFWSVLKLISRMIFFFIEWKIYIYTTAYTFIDTNIFIGNLGADTHVHK